MDAWGGVTDVAVRAAAALATGSAQVQEGTRDGEGAGAWRRRRLAVLEQRGEGAEELGREQGMAARRSRRTTELAWRRQQKQHGREQAAAWSSTVVSTGRWSGPGGGHDGRRGDGRKPARGEWWRRCLEEGWGRRGRGRVVCVCMCGGGVAVWIRFGFRVRCLGGLW